MIVSLFSQGVALGCLLARRWRLNHFIEFKPFVHDFPETDQEFFPGSFLAVDSWNHPPALDIPSFQFDDTASS